LPPAIAASVPLLETHLPSRTGAKGGIELSPNTALGLTFKTELKRNRTRVPIQQAMNERGTKKSVVYGMGGAA